jgi:hypothetical protein
MLNVWAWGDHKRTAAGTAPPWRKAAKGNLFYFLLLSAGTTGVDYSAGD